MSFVPCAPLPSAPPHPLWQVSSLRMLVKHSLWPGSNNANNNAVSGREGSFNHSLSQSTTMSVRRKTLSTVSDTSMT